MLKKSDDGGGDSGSMDIEFINVIRKKRESGKTEGEAVLEYLDENSKKNKPKKSSTEQDIKMSKFLGRPV